MAHYEGLAAEIAATIKDNTEQAITGDTLQRVLLDMVAKLGDGYQFKGVAPSNPGDLPDGDVFYLAYGNSGIDYLEHYGLTLKPGEIAFFYTSDTTPEGWDKIIVSTAEPVVIDVEWRNDPIVGHFTPIRDNYTDVARYAAEGRRVFLRGASAYHNSRITLPVNWGIDLGPDGYALSYNWWDEGSDTVRTDTVRL